MKMIACFLLFDLCLHSSYLCDVTLKSEDGKEFPCHKSVLCARLGETNHHIIRDVIVHKHVEHRSICNV